MSFPSPRRSVGSALLLAVCLTTAAGAVEQKTAADYDRHLQQWLAEKLQSDFQALGKKDAPWAGKLGEFFPEFAVGIGTQFGDEDQFKRLQDLAAALVAAGCDDPVFLMCQARIKIAKQRLREAQLALRKLLPVIQKAGYPPLYTFLNLSWTRRTMPGNGIGQPMPKLYEAAIAAARDPACAGPNCQVYVRSVMPQEPAFLEAAAAAFAKPDSGVDPWIAAMVAGRLAIVKAWEARGSGLADQVAPAGWKGFEEQLAVAREQLTKAHEMHPEFPEAAVEMITVSKGDRSDEERLWFDRAVEAEFDHAEAYHLFGRDALLPRWGGSHEEMLEFGRQGLATGRFETRVPATFLDAVITIGGELPDFRAAFALPGVYDDCLKVVNGYLAAAKSPRSTRTWKSRLVVIHWATGHYAEACSLLDELGDELAPRALEDFRVKPEDVVAECRLFAGPHAAAVEGAEELIAADKVAEALAAYEGLAGEKDFPAAVRRLVAGRIATLKMAQALAEYEWVDIQPPADLGGWRRVGGDWKVEADGTLTGATPQGLVKLICESEFGQDLEFTAEFDLALRPDPEKTWARLLIMLAHAAGDDQGNHAVTLRLYGQNRGFWLRHSFDDEGAKWVAAPLKEKNTLRVVLWDGTLSVFVNGAKVLDKFAVPPEWLGGGGLAIGEYNGAQPLSVRVRKMRARRLEKAPEGF